MKTDTIIREVDSADYEALVCFLDDNNVPDIVRYFRPFPFSSETAYYIARKPHQDKYYIALLGNSRRIVGLSMLRGWDEGFSVPSFGVVVDHRFHGQGIGRRLLEYTLDEARKINCQRVRLSVYASNSVAVRLYESLGFREHTRQDVMIEQGQDVKIIMTKELK